MKTPRTFWFAVVALAQALPAQVMAQTAAAQQAPGSIALHSAGHAGFARPVATSALEAYRGGTSIVNNDMQLSGTTAGNTAINVATGTNAISAGAFSNMSGLPVVIQNSGANVLIQNAVILNLQIH